MKIVLDAHAALQGASRLRGIGRYAKGLLSGLLDVGDSHDIMLSVCAGLEDDPEEIKAHFAELIDPKKIVVQRLFSDVLWRQASNMWRRKACEYSRAYFHHLLEPDALVTLSMFEGFNENVITTAPMEDPRYVSAVILYDLIPLLNPEKYLGDPNVKAWYFNKLTMFKQHDLLLGISEHAVNEAVDNIDRSRHDAISISTASSDFFSPLPPGHPDIAAVKEKFALTAPFFFYLGAYEPRKNYDRLIQAFSRVSKAHPSAFKLVLGFEPETHQQDAINKVISDAGLNKSDVIITGRLGDPELRALYNACYAFVFPSLHEGFGLPPLEAMQCGAAVIASNTTSVPEVVGLKDALFDPMSTDAIAQMLQRLIEDKSFYKLLKKNASVQPARFSWRKTAMAMIEAIEKTRDLKVNKNDGTGRLSRSHAYRSFIDDIANIAAVEGGATDLELAQLAHMAASNIDEARYAWRRKEAYSSTPERVSWLIEGPFDSTYSLALLNRETARAMKQDGFDVRLFSSEGTGDFKPDLSYLETHHPDVLGIITDKEHYPEQEKHSFVSRNLYPPRVNDMDGCYNYLHHYAWEEGLFPQDWVETFNLHLDGVACLSTHVKKVLQDSGVMTPLTVSGCGVDHWERIEAAPEFQAPGKSFRFLHVSSCFPRKGADVLLKAYGEAFSNQDDVTLIIKTFENPHNDILQQLNKLKEDNPEYPDTVVLFDDWSESQLKALYKACDVLVAPSRAEGYGLPMAEAMLSGLAVITTGWSGQLDFCNEDTAWLVDYDFALADTHFEQFGSVWADPKKEDLSTQMRHAFKASAQTRKKKAEAGRNLLLKEHNWRDAASRFTDAALNWSKRSNAKRPTIGWVTTWNCKCGIATYSKHFLDRFPTRPVIFAPFNDDLTEPDEGDVQRVWKKNVNDFPLHALEAEIAASGIDSLVVQFNYGFFDFSAFNEFLLCMKKMGVATFVVMHSTVDPVADASKRLKMIAPGLRACARVIVHSHHDLNRLKDLGVVDNATLMPHGCLVNGPINFTPHSQDVFTIASYGFCLPHKGLDRLAEAFDILAKSDPSLRLHLVNAIYPDPTSHDYHARLVEKIRGLPSCERIKITSDFLDDEASFAHLQKSDMVVFPYGYTGESASGAVRFGIASGRPVATTAQTIFKDVEAAVFQLPNEDAAAFSQSLRGVIDMLLSDPLKRDEKIASVKRWREAHSYRSLARRLYGIICAVHQDFARGAFLEEAHGGFYSEVTGVKENDC